MAVNFLYKLLHQTIKEKKEGFKKKKEAPCGTGTFKANIYFHNSA